MKVKRKTGMKWASCDTWKADIGLFVGPHEGLKKWCKKNLSSKRYEKMNAHFESREENDFTQGIFYPVGGGGGIIWMPKYIPEVLVHEISHAVFQMLASKGVAHNVETDEAYAYLIEYLYKCLTKK